MNRAGSPIGIAGGGRLGQALGRLLLDRGQPVVAVAGRDLSRTAEAARFIGKDVQAVAYSDLPALTSRILITVPDDALPSVTQILASSSTTIAVALHTCGSRGPEALIFLEEQGTSCGALHPLQTISTAEQGVADLPGAYFGITGVSHALAWALEICTLLNGAALTIPPESRPLYHAAAVMASNYVVAMIDAAVILMGEAGVAPEQALPALGPLIRASATNALAMGPVQALTGPIERGDEQTVASHVRALRKLSGSAPESIEALYSCAGLYAIDVARQNPRRRIAGPLHRYSVMSKRGEPMNEMKLNEIKPTEVKPSEVKKVWPHHLKEMKQRGEKIAMLTAYDALMARLFEQAGIDVLLVGDSLGMVLLGYSTTLPVTLDDMVHHTKAVSRGARRALVVADMPFLTYQVSIPETIRNAGRLIQEGGANSVKIEGGRPAAEAVARLAEIGIPVMGHLGLNPQSVNQVGGFRQQAKSKDDARRLIEDAHALEQAGAYSIVLESIPEELARTVSAEIGIPTIGIGAGPDCDGQVLVCYDALGMTGDGTPSFAKRYAQLGVEIVASAKRYAQEVKEGGFPVHRRAAS